MDQIAKSDAFFIITSIAVVIITAAVIVAVVYIVKILNDIKHISTKAKTETDLITEDLDELRGNLRQKGARLKFFSRFFNKLRKKK